MKFLNQPLSSSPYTETSQSNPLRYYFMYRVDGDNYLYTSGEFKCKDYFNEVVSSLRGVDTTVYGMNYFGTKRNEGEVYVLLKNIVKRDVFLQNLAQINIKLVAEGFPEFTYNLHPDADKLMLCLPNGLFPNTYTVSLFWYLVRISNISMPITDWVNHPTRSIDRPFGNYHDRIMAGGFKPPVEGFWYYAAGPTTAQDVETIQKTVSMASYYIHNNGCVGWVQAVDIYSD